MIQHQLLKHVEELRDLKRPLYVAATGAGAGLQELLWAVPGCSSFLVGASFPYASSDLSRFVGFDPKRSCCEDTAILMALEAHARAGGDQGNQDAIGLGLTATVATNRVHKGDHRVHIATVSKDGCRTLSSTFIKGEALRVDEGNCCDILAFNLLLVAAGLPPTPFYRSNMDRVAYDKAEPVELLAQYTQAKAAVAAKRDILFAGAFNPIHEGHVGIATQLEKLTSQRVVFGVEATMPHKPSLSFADLLKRRTTAAGRTGRPMVITHGAPLYVDKAKHFDCDLVMGADALFRMMDPKWGPSLDDIIATFRQHGTIVYVIDRVVGGTSYRLVDCDRARECADIFLPVDGNWQQSSTAIREAVMS